MIRAALSQTGGGREPTDKRPMPWHVAQSYRVAGQAAQHAFWGQGGVERLSMLHQLALQVATP